MTIIFGGTTEGRELAIAAHARGEDILVSVTSEYARSLLPADIPCRVGVLDEPAMLTFLATQHPDQVIDATHPFAIQATRTIRACCEQLNLPLTRIERPTETATWRDAVEWVPDTAAAIAALSRTSGSVLLTTGSKTLLDYAAALPPEHLWARVLPTHAALDICLDAGLPQNHILAMQGPFSAALNAALYDQLNIAVMVTKDSGAAGGVDEKILPALARGIHVIVIARP